MFFSNERWIQIIFLEFAETLEQDARDRIKFDDRSFEGLNLNDKEMKKVIREFLQLKRDPLIYKIKNGIFDLLFKFTSVRISEYDHNN